MFCTVSLVLLELKNLKPSRTTTPDGFSSHTLLTLDSCLAQPLAYLFEYLFSYHHISLEWKNSYINPIYKKGSRTDPAKYRPISITSIVCRIIKRIIHKLMSSYLLTNSLLSPVQHGFQTGKSSITNHLEATTNWRFPIDSKMSLDVLNLDLTKTFDSISHAKLIHKLSWFGISGNLLSWLSSYITFRFQCTNVDGCNSNSVPTLSGVPQGSVFGPSYFYYSSMTCHNFFQVLKTISFHKNFLLMTLGHIPL